MIRGTNPDHAALSAVALELTTTINQALTAALATPDLPGAVNIVQEALASHWDSMLPAVARDALLVLAAGAWRNGFTEIPGEVEDSGAGVMLSMAQGPGDLAAEIAGSMADFDPDADVMRTLAVLAVLSDRRRGS